MCEDTCDTADLVISELVTNAIVHTASGTVVCELHDTGDLVRIAVRDQGCAPGEPHPSPQRPEEEHGRGLFLVDALCQAWGAQEHGPGLLVWADLARGAEVSPVPAEPHDDIAAPLPHNAGSSTSPGLIPPQHDAGSKPSGLVPPPHGTASVRHAAGATPRGGLTAPRNDLGWGSRPKPVPSDGTGDEDDHSEHTADHTEHAQHAQRTEHAQHAQRTGQDHRDAGAEERTPAPAWRAHHSPVADGPLRRVGPQRRPSLLPHPSPLPRSGTGTGGRDLDRDPA